MQKMTYKEMLLHPKWQKKRLEILEANDFQCELCLSEEKQLNVHHGYYDNALKLWEYDDLYLRCLCYECHKDIHGLSILFNKEIAEEGIDYLYATIGGKLGFFSFLGERLAAAHRRGEKNPWVSEELLEAYIMHCGGSDG